MRFTAAVDVPYLMRFLKEELTTAAEHAIMNELLPNDETGGLIAVNTQGNITMPFNSLGVYRGSSSSKAQLKVAIF